MRYKLQRRQLLSRTAPLIHILIPIFYSFFHRLFSEASRAFIHASIIVHYHVFGFFFFGAFWAFHFFFFLLDSSINANTIKIIHDATHHIITSAAAVLFSNMAMVAAIAHPANSQTKSRPTAIYIRSPASNLYFNFISSPPHRISISMSAAGYLKNRASLSILME